jgi:hypothetical protein
VCARTYVYDGAGNYAGLSSRPCTSGAANQGWYLFPSAVTLPPEGTAAVVIDAQDGGHVKNVAHWWNATITP